MKETASEQSASRDRLIEQSGHSSPGAPIETELKFHIRADDLAGLRDNSIFAKATVATLRSVYFDTVDQKLHKSGFSLRVREANGIFIQTVKSIGGAGLFDRAEWECNVGSAAPSRLAWKETPVAKLLNWTPATSLLPIFSTTVVRTVGIFEQGDDLVEVSLDQGEVQAGTCSEPILELELELKSGSPAKLFAIARRLGAHAVLRLSFTSKAERGYRLARLQDTTAYKAHSSKMLAIAPILSTAAAFPIVVRDCLIQIAGNAELLQCGRDSEVLHQLRVGLRRLRAGLTLFKPILPHGDPSRLKTEAKWAGGKLAEARNIDVLIANMRDASEEIAPGDKNSVAVAAALAASRDTAYDRLRVTIASKRFADLLLDCAQWIELDWHENALVRPSVRRLREEVVATFARTRLKRLRRHVLDQGRHLRTLDPEARHSVRIKTKNLRYAVEFFAGCFGDRGQKRYKKFISALSQMQDALGELNDLTTVEATFFKAMADQNETTLRAGHPSRKGHDEEAKLLNKAIDAFKTWHHSKTFWSKAH